MYPTQIAGYLMTGTAAEQLLSYSLNATKWGQAGKEKRLLILCLDGALLWLHWRCHPCGDRRSWWRCSTLDDMAGLSLSHIESLLNSPWCSLLSTWMWNRQSLFSAGNVAVKMSMFLSWRISCSSLYPYMSLECIYFLCLLLFVVWLQWSSWYLFLW